MRQHIGNFSTKNSKGEDYLYPEKKNYITGFFLADLTIFSRPMATLIQGEYDLQLKNRIMPQKSFLNLIFFSSNQKLIAALC